MLKLPQLSVKKDKVIHKKSHNNVDQTNHKNMLHNGLRNKH